MKLLAWQTDPSQLKSDIIQVWFCGIPTTDVLSLQEAREKVQKKEAFVLNSRIIEIL